jgi:Zn-dependent protease
MTLSASCEAAEATSRREFLAATSLFSELSPETVSALAEPSTIRSVAAGAMILSEGERGEECYLICDGEVALLRPSGAEGEREIGRVGEGGLIGEQALVLDGSAGASVRATRDCRLLVIGGADLLRAMAADRRLAERILELIRFRDRPRRAPGVLAFRQIGRKGEDLVVLKEPAQRQYFRLSMDGWRLWQAIDGEASVRDLIIQNHAATGRFEPQRMTALLEQLAAAGFVETARLPPTESLVRPQLWATTAAGFTRLFTWQTALTGCDRVLSRLYTGGIRALFTPLGLTLLAAVAVSGFVAFALALVEGRVALGGHRPGGALLAFFYIAIALSIVLHESGHAFAAKHFGGEVDRIGFGWFWFGPVAYVNTSDMWTKDRWPRVAVDLAGIAVNAVCAGFAAFAALAIADGPWSVLLWQFVLASWWTVLANLNPLFEYDGFFALTDWLDRPNLRRQAVATLWRPGEWRRRRFEVVYALSGLVFIGVTGAFAVDTYKAVLEPWLASFVGERLGCMGVWPVGLLFLVMAILRFVPAADERSSQATPHRFAPA